MGATTNKFNCFIPFGNMPLFLFFALVLIFLSGCFDFVVILFFFQVPASVGAAGDILACCCHECTSRCIMLTHTHTHTHTHTRCHHKLHVVSTTITHSTANQQHAQPSPHTRCGFPAITSNSKSRVAFCFVLSRLGHQKKTTIIWGKRRGEVPNGRSNY